MSDRLPLNGLRVFEAAARHASFLKAADELAITPGAVSRQIKGLEVELEVRLFERFNRAVRLTEAGESLAVSVRQGLATLQGGVDALRSRRDAPLVVSVLHSLAAKWLVPRLHLFQELYPDIQVLVAASDAAADLVRDQVDVALRLGRGPYPGLDVTHLTGALMFPVCSPRVLEAGLETPADLAKVTLLQDVRLAQGEPGWTEWFAKVGVEGVEARGPQFSNTYLALEAALAGRGVALAQQPMVLDDLAAGRLVAPFETSLESPFSYWVLSLPEKAQQPNVRRFRTWLLAQADADGLPRIK